MSRTGFAPSGCFQAEFYIALPGQALELIRKERTTGFCNPTHSVLVLGFGECRMDEFFGDLLCNQPVEASRMLVAAYLKHLENEAADSNLFRGWQALVWRLRFRERFFKTVNV
jgi:hypothetical protein